VSGHDGGTGAAPLTSIRHAGAPWELGLAETHQTLVANGLRDRVVVQVDGQLRTGRDVVIAALLGAQEFGFATAPLVVSGCVMMRVCHLDTCPVGIATQRPDLRERFTGKPEFIESFFTFLAEQVRELLASVGLRSLDEALGRTDLLDVVLPAGHAKAATLDLAGLLTRAPQHPVDAPREPRPRDLDDELLEFIAPALERGSTIEVRHGVRNVDRAVGTRVGYHLTRRHPHGLADDTVVIRLDGSAGQSLGAFLPRGITLTLTGDANDYLGKGLSGGRIVVRPHESSPFRSEEAIIAGNVVAYGATSGEIFARGLLGERFCVRNSGAIVVAEGVGDHGCEYMTGGRAVILGPTGRNFAAGMSGGLAFVYDAERTFERRCNLASVDLEPIDSEDDEWLTAILTRFVAETGSVLAAGMLADWRAVRSDFVAVVPHGWREAAAARAFAPTLADTNA
jgi:glutamate synthase (NADPH/NADH) large chain